MLWHSGRQVALAATLDLSNVDDDSEEFAATNIFGRHDPTHWWVCHSLDMGLYGYVLYSIRHEYDLSVGWSRWKLKRIVLQVNEG